VEGEPLGVWNWPTGPLHVEVGGTLQLCGFGIAPDSSIFMDQAQTHIDACVDRYWELLAEASAPPSNSS